MEPKEDFDFPTILHRIRSFHFKWEMLKEERDALRTSLVEANSKIAELEAVVTKYKTKDLIIEKERYILSLVIQSLHKEVLEEETLSKKIDKIEENVTLLGAAIENSLSDENGTSSSYSSIHEPESHEIEKNFDCDNSIRNNHQNDKSRGIDKNFFNGNNELSFSAFFNELSKLFLLPQTSLSKEEEEIPIETTPTFSSSPSTSNSHGNAVSIMDKLHETKSKIKDCKEVLPDFTSSLSQLRPGYSHENAKLYYRSFSHNEISSFAVTTSPEVSFQETMDEIKVTEVGEVTISNSSNEQNEANDTLLYNNETGEMRISGNPPQTIDTSIESADVSGFNAMTNLHDVQRNFNQNKSIKLEKNPDSGYDNDRIPRPVHRPFLPYNLRKRKSKSFVKKGKSSRVVEEVASDSAKSRFSSEGSFTIPFNSIMSKTTPLMKICLICKKENQFDPVPQFVTYRQLDQHILDNHPEPSPTYNRCPYVKKNCIRHFKFIAHLRLHITKRHQKEISGNWPRNYFFQPKISSNYSSEDMFENNLGHKNRVEQKDSPSVVSPKLSETKITCIICGYVANSLKTITIHRIKWHAKTGFFKKKSL